MTEQPEQPAEPARQSWFTTLGWACYLACSWTWCIGMFLPVLLVRDFGLWGFVVFAVPNVLGAAAMGWVLSRAAASQIIQHNPTAIPMFSAVTVLFQAYFLGWIISANDGDGAFSWTALVTAAAVLIADMGWGRRSVARRMALAAITLAASIGVGILILVSPSPVALPSGQAPDVLALAPVCCFGFLLCPYLDATFLQAAAAQDQRQRRASFTLGFGVLFAAMILITLFYAGYFLTGNGVVNPAGSALLRGALSLHLAAQLTFTIIAHQRLEHGYPRRSGGVLLVIAVVVLGGLLSRFVSWDRAPLHGSGMTLGEVTYRLFMAFYGLVFPAYVWLCMIPTRDGHSGTRGRSGQLKLLIWAAAVALAAPAFWMGFIERRTWWLAPGLAVVLVARLLLPRRTPAPT